MSGKPLKVAVAGLGTVGAGVVTLLRQQAEVISERAGRAIVVTAVSAKDRKKDRGLDLSNLHWYDDSATMAAEADVDVVVEVIGGGRLKVRPA